MADGYSLAAREEYDDDGGWSWLNSGSTRYDLPLVLIGSACRGYASSVRREWLHRICRTASILHQ